MRSILEHGVGSGADGWGVLGLWSFDPLVLVIVVLPGVLYGRGLRQWHNRPSSFASWRPYLFYGGLAALFLALSSPIDSLADDMFTFHMLQHLIIQMIAPPLMLLGAPTTPILKGMPKLVRLEFVRPLVRNRTVRTLYNGLTIPVVTWLLFTLSMWTWHFWPGAYETAITNAWAHTGQHVSFSVTSLLLWWTIVDPKPLRSRLSYPLRMVFIFAILSQVVSLGAAITFRGDIIYTFYETRTRLWGLTALEDQQSAGALMWIAGVMMLVLALSVTFGVWWEKQEKQSRAEEFARDQAIHISQKAASGAGQS